MININLFAGPGTGKSSTAAGIFHQMKIKGYNVEYIQEYAKDLTYGKDDVKLSDQLLILGKQHHRMFRIQDQVDYIIHDSPCIAGMVYASEKFLPLKEFEELIKALYNRYNHINIFLKRNFNIKFQESGRRQSLEDALLLDENLKLWLNETNIIFHEVAIGVNTINDILKIIENTKFISCQS